MLPRSHCRLDVLIDTYCLAIVTVCIGPEKSLRAADAARRPHSTLPSHNSTFSPKPNELYLYLMKEFRSFTRIVPSIHRLTIFLGTAILIANEWDACVRIFYHCTMQTDHSAYANLWQRKKTHYRHSRAIKWIRRQTREKKKKPGQNDQHAIANVHRPSEEFMSAWDCIQILLSFWERSPFVHIFTQCTPIRFVPFYQSCSTQCELQVAPLIRHIVLDFAAIRFSYLLNIARPIFRKRHSIIFLIYSNEPQWLNRLQMRNRDLAPSSDSTQAIHITLPHKRMGKVFDSLTTI